MLRDVIERLTESQRAELQTRGINRQRLYSWRSGERLPTEVQVVDLADVAHADWSELQKEITVLRAPPERRGEIAAALKWALKSYFRNLTASSARRVRQLRTVGRTWQQHGA